MCALSDIEEDESHCEVISVVNKDDIQYEVIDVDDEEDRIPSGNKINASRKKKAPKQQNMMMNMEGIPQKEKRAPLVDLEEDESHCEVISVVKKDDIQYEVINIADGEDHIPSANKKKASHRKKKAGDSFLQPKQPNKKIIMEAEGIPQKEKRATLVDIEEGESHCEVISVINKDGIQYKVINIADDEDHLSTANKIKASNPKKKAPKQPSKKVSEMVVGAITSLKERSGSSLQAIKKHIDAHYKVDINRLSPFIKKYLKSAVVGGALVQTKGKGATTGSFKLGASGQKSKPGKKKEKKAKKEGPKVGRVCAIDRQTSLNRQLENHQHGVEQEKEIRSKDVLRCIVTTDGQKRFRCEVCHMNFDHPAPLQEHLNGKKHKKRMKNLSHNNEETESLQMGGRVCAMCATKATFNRHVENHEHGAEQENQIRSKDAMQFIITTDGRELILCGVCNLIYRSPVSHQKHLNGTRHKRCKKSFNVNKKDTESLQMGRRESAIKANLNRQLKNHQHGPEHKKKIRSTNVLRCIVTTDGRELVLCEVCNRVFNRRVKLQKHLKAKNHQKNVQKLIDKEETELQKMGRRVCAIKAALYRHLKNHQYGAEQKKKIRCTDVPHSIVETGTIDYGSIKQM